MTAQLVQFPVPATVRTQARNAVDYPARATVMLPEMTLCIDPEQHTYDALAPTEEVPGAPQVFAQGDEVVLDLGDCTPMRTLLTLDADTALVWAASLMRAAHEARKAERR